MTAEVKQMPDEPLPLPIFTGITLMNDPAVGDGVNGSTYWDFEASPGFGGRVIPVISD